MVRRQNPRCAPPGRCLWDTRPARGTQGDWPPLTPGRPPPVLGARGSPARPVRLPTDGRPGEGEGGGGGGGAGAAGLDPPLDGAVGPAVGGDAAPGAVCRLVDDVPRAEALPTVGADTGCGEQGGWACQGQGRRRAPAAPNPRGPPALTLGVVGAPHAALGADAAAGGGRGWFAGRPGAGGGQGRQEPPHRVPGGACGHTFPIRDQGARADDSFLSGTAVGGPGGSGSAPGPTLPRNPEALQETRPQEPLLTPYPWRWWWAGPRRTPPSSWPPALDRSPGVAVLVCGHRGARLVGPALHPAGRRRGWGRALGHTLHVVLIEDGGLRGAPGVAACGPERPESPPDGLPAASPPRPPASASPGPQRSPPSRPWVSCRHWPRGFRQVRRQGAPQGW